MYMILAFIIYFCILTAIGIYFYHSNKNASDYIIGNRSINYVVTAIATQASDMGIWLFLAFPAAVYTNGLFECWTAIGLIICMFLNWQYIAPKLRYQTEQYQALTISTYLSKRFNDTSGLLRMLSALITLWFFTAYISSALVGMGRLFNNAFGIDYIHGTIIGVVAGLSYTLIGGFIAVAWGDLFQGLFLLVMIIIVPVYTYVYVGGYEAIITAAATKNVHLSLLSSEFSIISALFLAASWGLGYFGQPHILVNFMGIDDPKKIASAKWIGISWQIMVLSAATMIGVTGLAFNTMPIGNAEDLFIIITKTLFNPLLAGFVLCAILAATLSTMDSHILVSGSTFAEDLYTQWYKKTTQTTLMWISRLASLGISAVALYIASFNNNSVYNLVNYAWSGTGSAFGPLIITALYSTYITRNAAIAGMMVGALVSGLWPWCVTSCSILPLVPGFFSGLATLYLVSWLSKGTRQAQHAQQTHVKPQMRNNSDKKKKHVH